MLRKSVTQLIFVLALVFAAGTASADDISGKWTFTVDIAGMGGGTPTVTIVQDAENKISGTYDGQLGSGAPITGEVTGKDFQFSITGEMGSVTYKGSVQDDGTLKGTLDLGGMAEGTFTAKKAEA